MTAPGLSSCLGCIFLLLHDELCQSSLVSPALTSAAVCLSLAVRRNSLGSDLLFLGKSHPLFDFIHELYRAESLEVTKPKNCSHTSDVQFKSDLFIFILQRSPSMARQTFTQLKTRCVALLQMFV